jgi:glycerol-3-phosphate dehydrogenase
LLRAWNFVLRRNPAGAQAVGARSGDRYLFLSPWGERAIVGTEYEPADAPGDADRLPRFLEAVQCAFPWAGIAADDVTLVHMGLVPGERGAAGLWSHSLVTDHERSDGVAGLVSMLGAKYTTARAVAETAVDCVVARLGRGAPACKTATTPLPKARPLPGPPADQARAAVRDEMAIHLSDVLLRRTSLGSAEPAAEAVVADVGAAMAKELGWDAPRLAAERTGLRAELLLHSPRLR